MMQTEKLWIVTWTRWWEHCCSGCVTVGPDAECTVWWARWRLDCGSCVSLSEWVPLPLTRTLPHSCPPRTVFSLLFCPSQPNNCSTTSLHLFCGLFSNSLPFFFISCFFPPLLPPPSLPLSSVCSRVMVCCGLPTQRNNISGVGKVQPHMSCAAEGRLCEVRPIPHGSYSSQPRDQRPAIPLPSSFSSPSSFLSPSLIKWKCSHPDFHPCRHCFC